MRYEPLFLGTYLEIHVKPILIVYKVHINVALKYLYVVSSNVIFRRCIFSIQFIIRIALG